MPSYDYEVDLESLVKAATGMSELLQAFKDKDVEDFVPTEGDLGSDVVWHAVEEFKDRWEEGVKHLSQDVEEMSGRLGKIAMNYAETDTAGKDGFAARASDVTGLTIMGR